MKIIEMIRNQINTNAEVERLKLETEHYKREYKRELLMNQAYSHAILQAVLAGKIDNDQQRLLYDLVNHEMKVIYDKLL